MFKPRHDPDEMTRALAAPHGVKLWDRHVQKLGKVQRNAARGEKREGTGR